MRWIFLSPHLDDAVLSTGGLIFEHTQAGIPVEIWTLMCGFPPAGEPSFFAQTLHTLWGFSAPDEAVQVRRAEDERAASKLDARSVHFDFLDAIYRQGPDGEWLYPQDVSIAPHPVDADLPARISEAVSMRLLPDDAVVCPFAIGGHVDHSLVRAAGSQLGRSLWFYADIPYLFNHPEQLAPNTSGLSMMVHPLSARGLEAWVQAVMAYSSQLSTVFSDPAEIPSLLRDYSQEKGGICLWRAENAGT